MADQKEFEWNIKHTYVQTEKLTQIKVNFKNDL